ncbi:MAG: hypothetical protein LQ338_007240, partial [Usnochroma carphineum]
MARGSGQAHGATPTSKSKSRKEIHGLNTAYRDMLAEAEAEYSSAQTGDEERPLKRRRVRGKIVAEEEHRAGDASSPGTVQKPPFEQQAVSKQRRELAPSDDKTEAPMTDSIDDPIQQGQVIYKDGVSDESDFAWEEVDLAQEADQSVPDPADGDDEQDLDLVLDADGKQRPDQAAAMRRKVLTAAEKRHIVSLLNPDERLPQFRQDEAFRQGLEKASDFFRNAFTITAGGMSRAYWADDPETRVKDSVSDLDLPLQKPDFLDSAKKLQGSRDIGAQFFCALLRSAGVETRLVCSLQVLPLTATTKTTSPQKPPRKTIPVIDYSTPTSIYNPIQPSSTPSKRPIGSTGGLTRFSAPIPSVPQPIPHPPRPRPKPKHFPSSPHPITWIEAFNPHTQKYIPIDPLTTHTINKPHSLTPSLSDPLNALTYAIAFNDDMTAKDVTRRYTRSYAAKVLKTRVDMTAKGKEWLARVLNLFRYPGSRGQTDKDAIEDADLARKEASEPMPRNILDFKHHPVYALERHLRRNEVVYPRKEIGKVSVSGGGGGGGGAGKARSESVFSRKNVLVCRTAEQWFRLGREIKGGEQAMKRLPPSSLRSSRRGEGEQQRSDFDDEEVGDDDDGGKALYAEHQTRPYHPPPIPPLGAPIPRNAFGNLDVYTPSMVPHRGWHSTHPLTSRAAKILGVDSVDAVTGFTFSGKGRGRGRGKAVVTGAVVWEGHREAVEVVVAGLEEGRREDEERVWRGLVLGWWRKMLVGLR